MSVNEEPTKSGPSTKGHFRYRLEHREKRGILLRRTDSSQPIKTSLPETNSESPFEVVTTVLVPGDYKDAIDGERDVSDVSDLVRGLMRSDRPGKSVQRTVLTVRSSYVIDALRAVVAYYPEEDFDSQILNFDYPYKALCHHLNQLRAYRDLHPLEHSLKYQKICNEHIDSLLQFLNDSVGHIIQQEEHRYQLPSSLCTFDNLWYFYKPGTKELLLRPSGRTQACVIQKTSYEKDFSTEPRFVVTFWYLDEHYGAIIRRVSKRFIGAFGGETPICNLSICPVQYYSNNQSKNDQIERQLIDLGRKQYEYTSTVYCRYYSDMSMTVESSWSASILNHVNYPPQFK